MPDNEDLNSELRRAFKDPETAARVANALVPSSRPDGWSKKSNAPYYKEVYAKEIKDTLDSVMATKQDMLYSYADFEKLGMSHATVYLRVNQSSRYLMKYMDPEGKYADILMNKVSITKERNVGVRISLLPEYRETGTESVFKPKSVVPKSDDPIWRKKLEEFLENAQPGETFHKSGLALDPDEIKELNDSFISVQGFIANITSYEIKIVRVDI